MRLEDTDEGAVGRDAGDDGVERFANACSIATAAMRLDISRSTFRAASSLDGAVARNGRQLVFVVRRPAGRDDGLDVDAAVTRSANRRFGAVACV